MGISGDKRCDFVVFTKKEMSIDRIPFDAHYWSVLETKLQRYYYDHFIPYATKDFEFSLSKKFTIVVP